MECIKCNAEIIEGRETCGNCGLPLTPDAFKKAGYTRRTGWIIFFSLWFYAALLTNLLFTIASLFGMITGEYTTLSSIGFLAFGISAYLCYRVAYGLWHLKDYGRKILLVFAYFWLILFPINTIIGILTIIYFKRPEIKALFSEEEFQTLTQHQIMEVAIKARKGAPISSVFAAVIVGFVIPLGAMATIVVHGLIIPTQMAKQKSTMKDMWTIATSIMDYITDHGYSLKQDGTFDENSQFYKELCPQYIRHLPVKDQWGRNIQIYCGRACVGKFGLQDYMIGKDDFLIVSRGRDGQIESWSYNASNPKAGLFIVKNIGDFDKDLIIWSGSWIRARTFGILNRISKY